MRIRALETATHSVFGSFSFRPGGGRGRRRIRTSSRLRLCWCHMAWFAADSSRLCSASL